MKTKQFLTTMLTVILLITLTANTQAQRTVKNIETKIGKKGNQSDQNFFFNVENKIFKEFLFRVDSLNVYMSTPANVGIIFLKGQDSAYFKNEVLWAGLPGRVYLGTVDVKIPKSGRINKNKLGINDFKGKNLQ